MQVHWLQNAKGAMDMMDVVMMLKILVIQLIVQMYQDTPIAYQLLKVYISNNNAISVSILQYYRN